MSHRELLIDVSRLVWRFWRGGLPTGIDRVCLAYVKHFGPSAQAVVQRSGRYRILTRDHSGMLFDLFSRGPLGFKRRFLELAARAIPASGAAPRRPGLRYLNVGHTGLDEPMLQAWVKRNSLEAIFLVHDLIPLTHPEFSRPGEPLKHRRRMQNVLGCASGVIGNSQATIDELADFAAAHDMRMPPHVAAWIAGPSLPGVSGPKNLGRPHFIALGTIEGRKNHGLLLRIWKRLVEKLGPDAPLLVIVGQRGWEASQAIALLDRAEDLRSHVIELGKCSDVELCGLIAGARALLMPSFAEGFGLPIAEALELGTPVIASDLSVFREFAHAIPTYLDPLDGPKWQATIEGFIDDSPERLRQVSALRGYRAPNWKNHFLAVDAWLETLS